MLPVPGRRGVQVAGYSVDRVIGGARRTWLLSVAIAAFAAPAAAERGGLDCIACEFEHWRDSAREHGLEMHLLYTGEQAWVRGGYETGATWLDNTDLTLTADMDSLLGWTGGEAFLYVLGNSGGSPSELAGDWQVVSNIDAPATWKVYELWYQQRWAGDRYSLKAGLYDLNSEFDAIDTATLFLNSAFGIGSEIAQSGENGPSIFPTTSLALRGRAAPGENVYVQAAVLDGVPGDPDYPRGTRIELHRDDGLLMLCELGYLRDRSSVEPGAYRKLAVGAWRYTAAVREDAAGRPLSDEENGGMYAMAESVLWTEAADPAQGLSAFLRYGVANQRINQVDEFLSGGVVYTGALPRREADRVGVGFAHARNSERFRDAVAATGRPATGYETVVELTYRAELLESLALQLDYQYIVNPGMEPQLDDAPVWLLRIEIGI